MSPMIDIESAYQQMRTIRGFEEWVSKLALAGEIAGATHEYSGQEAVAVGICSRLRADDIITSTHRGHGHLIAKGASVAAMMAELLGRAPGLNRGRGGSMHAADLSLGILGANGIVAAGAPIAAGAAWAARTRGDAVAVTFFGDGGINQGVLAETMNLAGIWQLPLIFACENNGYAVTLAADSAVAGSGVDRAAGFGMPAQVVDGMDVRAVAAAADTAIERARSGGGPTYLEFTTYRFAGHNTGEQYLGLGYRTDAEIAGWRERDPLTTVGQELTPGRRAEIDEIVERDLADAVSAARAAEPPDPVTAADYMYADLKPRRGTL